MSELMKKHRTKEIELHFTGPVGEKAAAISALNRLGFIPFQDTSAASAWHDSFPELQENAPGVFLAGARHREGR